MKSVEERRVVPISIVVSTCVAVLGVMQLFVVTGGLEIKSSWVQKNLPWAYEPYLHLVGENPDAIRSRVSQAPVKKEPSSSGMNSIAGFAPEELGISLENKAELNTNNVIREATKPKAGEPEVDPADAVPVG